MTAPAALAQPRTGIPRHVRRFTEGPFKLRLRDRALQIATSIPAGHIAIFTAVAIYYLATQKVPWITWHWNHLLPWSWWPDVRHDIRNGILESELAGGAVIVAFANGLRPQPKGRAGRAAGWLMGYTAKPDWADKAMMFLHIPNIHQTDRAGSPRRTAVWQYLFALPSVLLVSLPGNLAGFAWVYGIKPGILDLAHRAHLHLHGWSVTAAAGTGQGAAEANLARAGFDAKLIGIFGLLFFGRRVFLKLGVDYQEFLGEKHASDYVRNRGAGVWGRFRNWITRPRWPLPATYRAVVWHEITEAERTGCPVRVHHGRAGRRIILALIPAVLWAAWYGHGILAAHGGT